jgi:hypothetical protein
MPIYPSDTRHAAGGGLHEQAFICPYCWESISMLLDLSVREQTYVEDCEVCCRPIRIHYTVQRGTLADFDAARAQ